MALLIGELPSRGEFSEQIDSVFRAHQSDGSSFDLCLRQVDVHSLTPNHDNFSLLFQAPSDLPPEQSVFRLHHDAIGELDLFLVPIKKDESGLYYEAVINRLIA